MISLQNALFLLLVLASPAVGSFLAVLVDRLPRCEDVVRARSTCRGCGRGLRPRELIPVLSFALQGGRCTACAQPIPPWALYMELLAPGAAVLAVLAGGGLAEVLIASVLLWLLLTLAVSDLVWFRLPDPLTAGLALTALAYAMQPGKQGLWLAGLGGIIGISVFAALRQGYIFWRGREGLGLGDVKLMAGLGAFAGPYNLALMVLIASLLALALALLRRGVPLRGDTPLPFGAALCASAAVLWLLD